MATEANQTIQPRGTYEEKTVRSLKTEGDENSAGEPSPPVHAEDFEEYSQKAIGGLGRPRQA